MSTSKLLSALLLPAKRKRPERDDNGDDYGENRSSHLRARSRNEEKEPEKRKRPRDEEEDEENSRELARAKRKRTDKSYWSQRLEEHLLHAIAHASTQKSHHSIRTRIAISLDANKNVGSSAGDQRLKRFLAMLNNCGWVRHLNQITFHQAFLQACLPHIFREDWEANRVRIMEEMGLTRIRPQVLVVTPRRFGKSVAVAIFVISLLLCVPGIRICLFSTTKRTSGNLVEIIKVCMNNIPGARQRICKETQEELFFAASPLPAGIGPRSTLASQYHTKSDTSKLYAYPGL